MDCEYCETRKATHADIKSNMWVCTHCLTTLDRLDSRQEIVDVDFYMEFTPITGAVYTV